MEMTKITNIITEEYGFFSESISVTVTSKEIAEAVKKSEELSEQIKEVILDTLDKNSSDGFSSFSELLGTKFPPEVIEALQNCNEVIQLFM